MVLLFEIFAFAVALWLGCYLLARDFENLRFASLGLITYALSLALDILQNHAPSVATEETLTRLQLPLLLFPAFFWCNAMLRLLPEEMETRFKVVGQFPALLIMIIFYIFSATTNIVFDYSDESIGIGYFAFIIVAVILLGLSLYWLLNSRRRKTWGLLLVATLFFGLGVGILLLPLQDLPRSWLLLSIGGDLLLFGYAVAVLDAFEQGEAFLADFLYSLNAAAMMILIFGGQVALVMVLSTGTTFAMLILCLTTLTAAIFLATFLNQFQRLLDQVVFARLPRLRENRAALRETASALPRMNEGLDLAALDEAEFNRLTRRALSQLGNLPKLASSPLTQLPIVQNRLMKRGVQENTLERAAELKAVLTESIWRLKPDGDFGTSDEWRYYNALYFPYVMGLKPYSQRLQDNHLDAAAKAALEWFRTYIPERTLHNWQSAAAALVAQDIRERE